MKTNKQAITAPDTTKRPEGVLNIISVDEQNQEENSRNPQTSTLLLKRNLTGRLNCSDLNQQLKDTQEELKISEMLATLKDQQILELEQKLKALQANKKSLNQARFKPQPIKPPKRASAQTKTHTVRNVLCWLSIGHHHLISVVALMQDSNGHATAIKRTKPVIIDNKLREQWMTRTITLITPITLTTLTTLLTLRQTTPTTKNRIRA